MTCEIFGYIRAWRSFVHDDVIKWKHFPRYWPFVRGIHRSPVNSPHKGQWRRALMFTLICARINGWVNNREAGDLRRYRAHYDVIVMLANNTVSWSSICRLICKHWTYKMLVMYILCVSKNKLILSIIFMQYMGLYVFILSIYLVMADRMCVLYFITIIKLEVWFIRHCLGLCYATMLCTVYLTMFFCSVISRSRGMTSDVVRYQVRPPNCRGGFISVCNVQMFQKYHTFSK